MVIASELHIRRTPPRVRVDDYPAAQDRKMRFILGQAKDSPPLVIAGDLFHQAKPGPFLEQHVIGLPAWSGDSRTLYFLSNRGGTVDLWQRQITDLGEPDDDARPLTVGIGMQYAAFAPGGRRLAYSKGRAVVNVWRVPILSNREATWEDAEQLTKDEA